MTQRRIVRLALAFAAAAFLAACQTEIDRGSSRHLQPIPTKTLALMEKKGMRKEDPILMRIFKEESELEVWKRTSSGQFALLKSYEICRWSGSLGPKIREGDKQAPEGFYAVTPGQMNPNSSYYLSFDLGFPNAYDRAHGRTGAHLMVHGDCLSAGCYALTDEQVAEVYSIAREAFHGGQAAFQVQALPFRMTAKNMARRREDGHIEFWRNLKEGYDHFEVTRQPPQTAVCDRRYVFNASPKDGARFDSEAACPAYEVAPQIAVAVSAKKRADDELLASLVSGGLQPAAPYMPQNGRKRRTLDEPLVQVAQEQQDVVRPAAAAPAAPSAAPAPTATAAAAAPRAAAPLPAPSPTAFARPTEPAKPGGRDGILTRLGVTDEPAATGSATPTPAASTGAIATQPATASMASAPGPKPAEEKPFYRRWIPSIW